MFTATLVCVTISSVNAFISATLFDPMLSAFTSQSRTFAVKVSEWSRPGLGTDGVKGHRFLSLFENVTSRRAKTLLLPQADKNCHHVSSCVQTRISVCIQIPPKRDDQVCVSTGSPLCPHVYRFYYYLMAANKQFLPPRLG